MLEDLDAIDWTRSKTAYGPATDVPQMLRALDAANADVRAEAFHDAYGNIFHQGTRYPATALAVPFVIELAAQPTPKDLPELLSLISHLVAGYFGPTHGPRNATGALWGEQVQPMTDYGETRELLFAIETAAEPAVPLCVKLIAHPSADVRQAAARVLAGLHQFAGRYEVVPRIEDRFAHEDDASARAMLAFALTHLAGAPRVVELTADAEPTVQILATMGATRRGIATDAMANALVTWLSDDELAEDYNDLHFHSDGLATDIAALLPSLGQDRLAPALPMLFEKLARSRDFGAVALLEAALVGTFGNAPGPDDASALTAVQRELLISLANNQGFWMLGNALNVLSDHHLPSERSQMAEFLGIEVVTDPVEQKRELARMMAGFGAERSLESWREVLALDADDREALYGAANALVELEDPDAATELVDRLLELAPEDGAGWFLRGVLAARAGELDTALAAFVSAGELTDDYEIVDAARGNQVAVLQRLGRADEALALQLETGDAEDADDFYHRGLAQVKAGQYAECIESITHALEQRPDHANSHYTVACAYALSGDPDQALASIARALELEPELASDIAGDSDFASLADDLRFRRLVKPSA
jgi:tetratricopeptide (TPR) repeat protein